MIKDVEVNGRHIAVEGKGTFDDYLVRRGVSSEFARLNRGEKEKVFLKWKWGFESDSSNRDLQSTRNMLYGDETDETISQIKDPYEKHYIELTVRWERKCKAMAEKHGLGHLIYCSFSRCTQAEKIANDFSGRIVGGHTREPELVGDLVKNMNWE